MNHYVYPRMNRQAVLGRADVDDPKALGTDRMPESRERLEVDRTGEAQVATAGSAHLVRHAKTPGMLADPAMLEHVKTAGAWMSSELQAIGDRTGRVRALRGVGFMWGLDVSEPAGEIVARAREAGLLILTAGDHTLRLLPPLVASQDDLARGLAILEQVL